MSRHRPLLPQALRWYGPEDPVTLDFVRQAGAEGVFTALHEVPYGEAWTPAAIRARRQQVEAAGLRWLAVESVPVHEDVKLAAPGSERLLEAYAETLTHLGAEGIDLVVYNFMPALDWVRTDLAYRLPDGKECLRYHPVEFAAFEVFALEREGAASTLDDATLEAAEAYWRGLGDEGQARFVRGLIDSFPGTSLGLTLDDLRRMVARYQGLDAAGLRANLTRFLEAVVPAAEAAGVRLAVHPDDPPSSILGIPRVVSTAADLAALFEAVPSPANGVCFCCGSLGGRTDNDVPAMASRFASRIHATHLRCVSHQPDGSFHEADHLEGDVDLAEVARLLLAEEDRRRAAGRADRIPFRPDHGHVMADDLAKPRPPNPGYSYLGRMRGLAELRGVMRGLRTAQG